MATVDDKSSANVSSEALELLQCFGEGLDSVVYEIAEDRAKKRRDNTAIRNAGSDSPLQVEVQDVRLAAEFVMQQLKCMIQDGKLPEHIAVALNDMENCFRSRAGDYENASGTT